MDKNIIISVKTIFLTLLIGFGIYLIFLLGHIIGLFFVALLITISLEHTIQFFTKQALFNKPVPRPLAVLITYLIVFLSLSFGLALGFDPLITQSQKLIQTLAKHSTVISLGENIDISFSDLISSFAATSGGVFSATKSLFSNVTAIFSVLVLSVYLSIDWHNIKERLVIISPKKYKNVVRETVYEIENNVGLWLRGQAVLMLVIGVLSYVALVAVGVEFALALGIIAGILEIVPFIGPLIATVIAAVVALVASPLKALAVIFLFTLIQQLEGNILVPKVMQKVSGFSPIIILLALLIGSNLFGIMGAIVAVPTLMVGAIIVKKTVNFK